MGRSPPSATIQTASCQTELKTRHGPTVQRRNSIAKVLALPCWPPAAPMAPLAPAPSLTQCRGCIYNYKTNTHRCNKMTLVCLIIH